MRSTILYAFSKEEDQHPSYIVIEREVSDSRGKVISLVRTQDVPGLRVFNVLEDAEYTQFGVIKKMNSLFPNTTQIEMICCFRSGSRQGYKTYYVALFNNDVYLIVDDHIDFSQGQQEEGKTTVRALVQQAGFESIPQYYMERPAKWMRDYAKLELRFRVSTGGTNYYLCEGENFAQVLIRSDEQFQDISKLLNLHGSVFHQHLDILNITDMDEVAKVLTTFKDANGEPVVYLFKKVSSPLCLAFKRQLDEAHIQVSTSKRIGRYLEV